MHDAERRIQLLAWGVLLAAFAAFLLIVVGGPALAWQLAKSASLVESATVRVRVGNLGVEQGDRRDILGQGDPPTAVREGARLALLGAEGSSAFIRLFDGTAAMLERHGRLELREMRRPRFPIADRPPEILLGLDDDGAGATLTVSTPYAAPDAAAARLQVDTPHARVRISPDARVRFSLDAGSLRLAVDVGEAWVTAPLGEPVEHAVTVRVSRGERTSVPAGRIPSAATDALEDLVSNGDFTVPPRRENGWSRVPPGDARPIAPPALTHNADADGRTYIRLRRAGSSQTPADIVLGQALAVDLHDATSLAVQATLRIDAQSLPGGGDNAQEFPLILTLVAEDAQGDEFTIPMRFYAVPPDPDASEFAGARVEDGDVLVPLGDWYTFDSGELRDGSSPFAPGRVPVRLRRLEIKASGHDFDTRLDQVSVLRR